MTMAALALRVRIKPHSLLNCLLKTRTFCSNPSGPAESEPSVFIPGRKILETFSEEFEIGNRAVSIETGKIARFANGAVVIRMDDTNVLSTVASSKSDGSRDFLPLTVDYQEKQYAQGVIPTTFMRREGAPKERELLCGRLIDRSIRPLFPAGFYHEVQVMISVLSSDGRHDPDVMAANATSAALMLSDIPWAGPIAMIRVGRIDGKLVYTPTIDELSLSDLNLVYACTRDKTLMIEVQAREITENDLQSALKLAHVEAVKYLDPQIRLAEKAGKQKKEYKLSMVTDKIFKKIKRLSEKKIEAVFTDPTYGKFERGEALDNITQSVKAKLEEKKDTDSLMVLPKAVDSVRKQVVRKRIIKKGLRVDGRKLDEVRPLYCEAGTYPTLHGSSIFSRGDTQVLCTVTLGAPGDAQRLDSIVGPPTKRFMLHYSFPPFSINEVGKRGGLNRREVGHGTLAEKALLAVLPPEDEFPYTVRINSEVMASDGSTSMATVCGGSMALMDAGISLKEHVAGVSVGLISDLDPSTGNIKEYRILTDILGLEDHLGDMDFKIAGTKKGITAIQLDIKPAGIPLDIICESLEPARKGRCQILYRMEQEIRTPRMTTDGHAPHLVTLKLSNEALRRLVGPLGTQRKKIEQETGARIAINDGMVTIVAKSRSILEQAQEKIYFLVGREIEVGKVYKGAITSIKEYGAFVELNGAQQGLLHISELSHDQVTKVADILSIGQELSLMCIENDIRGNIKLSLKATLPQPKTQKKNSERSETITESSISKNKYEDDDVNNTSSSMPSIVVRSAVECDAQDIASNSSKITKTPFKTGSKTSRNSSSPKYSKESTVSTKTTQECGSKGGLGTMLNFRENTRSDKKVSEVTDKNTQDDSLLKNLKRSEIIEEELSISKNKYEDDDVDYALSSMPSIIVRSAAECDAQEIASNPSETTKTPFQTNSKNTRNSSSPKYSKESEVTYKTTQDRGSKGGLKTMLSMWENRGFDKNGPEVTDKNRQDNSRKDDFEGTSSFCILKDSDYSKTENVKSSSNSSFPKYSKGSKIINKTTQDNSSKGGLKSILNLLTIGEVDKRAPEVNEIKENSRTKDNFEDNRKTKNLNNSSNFSSIKYSKESNVTNKATQESIISKGVLDSTLNLMANKKFDKMGPEVKDGDSSKTKDVKDSSNYGSPKHSKESKVDLGKMLNLLANKEADKKAPAVNEKITEERSEKTDFAMFDMLGNDCMGNGKTKKVKNPSNSSSFINKKESDVTNNIMQDSGRKSHVGAMLNLFANKAENESSDEEKCRNERTNAESLDLGDTVAAKVNQIRARGLVLDVGGGLRGMYKFKENEEEKSYEVGKELKVMCSSFSSKGIPVFDLVED